MLCINRQYLVVKFCNQRKDHKGWAGWIAYCQIAFVNLRLKLYKAWPGLGPGGHLSPHHPHIHTITSLIRAPPHQLSLGMQQRQCIQQAGHITRTSPFNPVMIELR